MANTLTQKRIKKYLDKGNEITGDLIVELIADHAFTKAKTFDMYERYKASLSAVPIFNRTFENDATKINAKLNNDFFSEIIDVKVGYMLGKPVTYSIDKNKYQTDTCSKNMIASFISKMKRDTKTVEDYDKHYDFLS